jgi:hypothetical protein
MCNRLESRPGHADNVQISGKSHRFANIRLPILHTLLLRHDPDPGLVPGLAIRAPHVQPHLSIRVSPPAFGGIIGPVRSGGVLGSGRSIPLTLVPGITSGTTIIRWCKLRSSDP